MAQIGNHLEMLLPPPQRTRARTFYGRFFIQAPGGQVFRLAPLDGGV
ncbi:MAG: hypothetical protein HC897_06140 [Thermoanaerobaculia bacterium]|nr:hypothetical protein [Thermoanaerobaculia bacterium]